MGRIFGTDGARGIAITELTCELAMKIGRAAAFVLTKDLSRKPIFFVGKDTRVSSDVIEAALISGLCSVGVDVHLLGVISTPAVAMLLRKCDGDAGIVISASHNSMEYNGIKIFSSSGYKLSDEKEEEIEKYVLDFPEEIPLKCGNDIGRISYNKNAVWDYVRYLMKTVQGDLSGLKVAIDCANGAAFTTAEKLFTGLGATCFFINSTPDGTNINENSGSLHLASLMGFVAEKKCHVGIAFDGDADRCLAVDENGRIVDGDKIMAIIAKDLDRKGLLRNHTIVATVMSNLGLKKFAEENCINLEITNVGDRYVIEKMLQSGYNFGGEQSGHIILHDEATMGDGQLTAIRLLSILKNSGKKMSELAGVMEAFPQVMVGVKISRKWHEIWAKDKSIFDFVEALRVSLGSDGRILVRESGTEPIIRIMVEGKQLNIINQYALEIAEKIRQRCPK
ncbi:MAG: phosphoglucosamine mutase [Oscillospiraceae bacterium]